ncbi:MAG: Chromate resistance protein ChrB [Micromonosporaceae bacterium]
MASVTSEKWQVVVSWILLLVRLPGGGPSRHRVAVWRELRRVGALSLGAGLWAVPAAAVFVTGVERVSELVRRSGGNVLLFDGQPRGTATLAQLESEFNDARSAEWTEFVAECRKYEAEIAKERRIGKLTLAELDEEEQSLERLRRWQRELRARDAFGVAAGAHADEHLQRCTAVLEEYAEEVYRAVHAPLGKQAPSGSPSGEQAPLGDPSGTHPPAAGAAGVGQEGST